MGELTEEDIRPLRDLLVVLEELRVAWGEYGAAMKAVRDALDAADREIAP